MARPHRQAEVGRAIPLGAPVVAGERIVAVHWSDVVGTGIRVLVVLVAAVLTVRLARRVVPRAIRRLANATTSADERLVLRTRTLSGTVVGVIGVAVWATAFVTVVGELGFNLAPLLAGAGIVGLAVGFGAQQLVRDVIAGFFILVEDQFGVGDTVTMGAVTGTVESMSLRLTRVRGDDGVLHHVRNGDLGVVSNASRGYNVATVAVPLPEGADVVAAVDRVRAAMAALVAEGTYDELLLADPQVLGVTGFREPNGTPVLTLTARVRPEGRSRVQRELLQRALAALGSPGAPVPATGGSRRPR